MGPLTVLMVITPAHYSGAEHAAVYLAQGLEQRGHRVVFACKRSESTLSALADAGLEAHVLPIAGKANLAAPFALARLVHEVDADVIHTHLSTAALWGSIAGRLAGVPVVASVQALNTAHCFRLADLMAACSEGVRDHLIAQGVPASVIRILHNAVPGERYADLPGRAAMRADLGLSPQGPVLCHVAHLSPRKGHRYLLKAVARLRERWPELVCLLVGEGPERAALEGEARNLGVADAVRLLGYREDAPAVMQAADLVVLPSVWKEGLPVVLVEAAFVGRPVVASDAPGIREVVVDGETGVLVPPENADLLAEALAGLLADPGLAGRMGAAAKERARRLFTVERMAETAENIYRELLRDRGPQSF